MKVLITGVYGFIGSSVAAKLLDEGHAVIGIERLPGLMPIKMKRKEKLEAHKRFRIINLDLSDYKNLTESLEGVGADVVLHCAGQYSVTHTAEAMLSYVSGNLAAFTYILEWCRNKGVKKFIYASSSWAEDESSGRSLYGASKVYNEKCASTYHNLFGIECIGLRYSSVFGAWMRPDTGPFQIAKKVLTDSPVQMRDSFRYKCGWIDIQDAVETTMRILCAEYQKRNLVLDVVSPFERANMLDVLRHVETAAGKRAKIIGEIPEQAYGGMPDVSLIRELTGYIPVVPLSESIKNLVDWQREQNI